jgi:hypothetical protein
MRDMHPNFQKYTIQEALHEAGYDSYLTARIMILLSAKLHAGEEISSPSPSGLTRKRNGMPRITSMPAAKYEQQMPSFSDPFWKVYGNRLRVYGTAEAYVELNPNRKVRIPVRLRGGEPPMR